jgi:nucleoside-diphosphate-sugar epimerase
MGNKILVTGGCGFIGSALTRRLVEANHEVVVLDNFLRGNKLDRYTSKGCTVLEGDILDACAVSQAAQGVDVIYHLAAVLGVDIVMERPLDTMETEVIGTRNVIHEAVLNQAKVVYASTSGVYGKAEIDQAVKEDFPVSPGSSYAIAKRYNELYLKAMWQEKKLESISVRLFNVYGRNQDDRMVIPRFVQAALVGGKLQVYGGGGQTRDFTYLDDVVEAFVRLEKVRGCEIVNVATGIETQINALACLIIGEVGDGEEEDIDPPPGREEFEVQRRTGDTRKLDQLTGYQPGTVLADGLRKYVESI